MHFASTLAVLPNLIVQWPSAGTLARGLATKGHDGACIPAIGVQCLGSKFQLLSCCVQVKPLLHPMFRAGKLSRDAFKAAARDASCLLAEGQVATAQDAVSAVVES